MDVGGYRFYILAIFFYHALSLFTTLSGPPCLYRYIPESVYRHWRFYIGFPLGKVVRGGESERGRYAHFSGRALEM